MRFESVEFEGVIESHFKIFMFLANKYLQTLRGYERTDLIHEQIIACYKAMSKCDANDNVSSFIYAVSENKLKTMYRSQMRMKRKPKQLTYLENSKYEEAGYLLAEGVTQVEEVYYVQEVKQRASKVAKNTLSKFEYELYTQVVVGGKSAKEVAKVLGKSEKQIANGLSRMRIKLREKRDLITNDL